MHDIVQVNDIFDCLALPGVKVDLALLAKAVAKPVCQQIASCWCNAGQKAALFPGVVNTICNQFS